MRLAFPYALALLPLIPLALWLLRRQNMPAFAMSSVRGLGQLPRTWATRVVAALPYVRAVALALCVIALARPQWGVEATRIYSEGVSIAMVVDISSSMGALDLKIDNERANRLDVVKHTFREFVTGDESNPEGRDGDLIGLITFARYADSLTPLTRDHDALLTLLDQVEIVPFPEEDGTAIGDAVALGLDTLRQASGESKVMIVLTDGSSNAGDIEPDEAARVAEALGIRIHAIGAGGTGMAQKLVQNPDGTTTLTQTRSYIDEDTLEDLALRTGGAYFRAADANTLKEIYSRIDRMETARTVAENYQQYVEIFPGFVLLAFLLLSFEAVFAARHSRVVA